MSATTDNAMLTSLQRIDPKVSSVLFKTSYVMRYKWDDSADTWVKEKLEGPLVLGERSSIRDFAICILNRLTPMDSFQVFTPTTAQNDDCDFEFEVSIKARLVVYRLHDEIFALWFSSCDMQEMSTVATLLKTHLHAQQTMPQPAFTSGKAPLPAVEQQQAPVIEKDPNAPLTKEAFKDALISLICDNRFLSVLHAEYVQSKQAATAGVLPQNVAAAAAMAMRGPPPPPQPMAPLPPHMQPQQFQPPFYPPHYQQQQQQQQQPPPFYPNNANFAPQGYARHPHYQ